MSARLRGVLIHDAIFRTLQEKGIEARYLFGVDDYDPLDEIPAGEDAHFGEFSAAFLQYAAAGRRACPDMAEHYMGEFWRVFGGPRRGGGAVSHARYLSQREIQRGHRYHPAECGEGAPVYKEVSNSDPAGALVSLPDGLREVRTHRHDGRCLRYDGAVVSYRCRPEMVKWARGCGHEGKISPFDGRGKLPWKLEWVAKWISFPVTIEGAGKDHSTKGGSRDVSDACLRAIFQKEPPLNVPYEFFLVGGAKMSSRAKASVRARATWPTFCHRSCCDS